MPSSIKRHCGCLSSARMKYPRYYQPEDGDNSLYTKVLAYIKDLPNKVRAFFRDNDVFSVNNSPMNFQGSDTFGTVFGGIISICIYVLMISFTALKMGVMYFCDEQKVI